LGTSRGRKGESVCRGGVFSARYVTRKGKAQELIQEISGDIARFTQEGQVVVAGDWNCKIGRLASIAGGREFDRRNTSHKYDARGRQMVKLMNRSDMVILNGIRGSTVQDTYDGPRGGSVNDYIAVSREAVDKTSNIEYRAEMKNLPHTDHCGLGCTITLKGNGEVKNGHSKETGVKAEKVGYSIVGRVRSEQFWAWLEEEGEGRMQEVVEQMKTVKGDVEMCWEALKDGLIGVLHEGRKEAKRMNRKRKEGREIEGIEGGLKELKEERKKIANKKEGAQGEENVRKMKTIKNKIEKMRKRKRRLF